jgi:hypothetical protein
MRNKQDNHICQASTGIELNNKQKRSGDAARQFCHIRNDKTPELPGAYRLQENRSGIQIRPSFPQYRCAVRCIIMQAHHYNGRLV